MKKIMIIVMLCLLLISLIVGVVLIRNQSVDKNSRGRTESSVSTESAESNVDLFEFYDDEHEVLYVSEDGNDDNDGAFRTPLKTIQEGVDLLKPGMVLYVREGTYNENLYIELKGIEGSPFVISAYKDEKVIINGSGDKHEEDIFYIEDSSYLVINGFYIHNRFESDYPIGILVEGVGSHIMISNNHIYGINTEVDGHGIAVYGTSGKDAIDHLTIARNEVYDCMLGSSEALVVNGNVDGFKIYENKVYNNNNIGIDCIGFEEIADKNDQARHGEVYLNLVYNISSLDNSAYTDLSAGGIYIDGGKDIDVYQNIIYNCDIGIEISSEHYGKITDGVNVYDNYISNSCLYGIGIGGADKENGIAQDNFIEYNTLINNDISIAFQNSMDNIVRNNLIVSKTELIEGNIRDNEVSDNWWYSDVGNNGDFDIFEKIDITNNYGSVMDSNGDYIGYGIRPHWEENP